MGHPIGWWQLRKGPMPVLEIAVTDPRRPEIVQLVRAHLDFANLHSPPEDVHALDLEALVSDDITFYSATVDGEVRAMGALRELDESHGELKSMHTAAAARGTGLGRAMVEHLLSVARDRGYRRVSLETGSMDAFVPSRNLYKSFGFEECPPFAGYVESSYSVCMTLEISP